uniref:non-specific serine/threonine protein kinase n=1 Tax=Lepisosteus oculatus TaxID=7918 RepID=W5NG38_LEPOC
MSQMNYVGRLNEYRQKHNLSLQYVEVSAEGPDHVRQFTMKVVLDSQAYPDGVGMSKREAKQNAAKNALEKLWVEVSQQNDPVNSSRESSCPSPVSTQGINHLCWLNEYGQKKGVLVQPFERSDGGPPHMPQFSCRFAIGNRNFPEAFGKNKKDAKKEAAKLAYEALQEKSTPEEEDSIIAQRAPQRAGRALRVSNIFLSLRYIQRGSAPEVSPVTGCLSNFCQPTWSCVFGKETEQGAGKVYLSRCALDSLKRFSLSHSHLPVQHHQALARHHLLHTWGKSYRCHRIKEQLTSAQTFLFIFNGIPHDTSILTTPERLNRDDESDYIIFRDSSDKKLPTGEFIGIFTSPIAIFHCLLLLPLCLLWPASVKKVKDANFTVISSHSFAPSFQMLHTCVIRVKFLQDFDLIETIDKGGFGSVFKARRKLEGKHYAVKIVKHTPKAEREVGALAGLQHQYIVRYFSSWLEDTMYQAEKTDSSSSSSSGPGTPKEFLYIQMELCEGGTLRSWIDQEQDGRPKDKEKTMSIFRQIVEGVKYIHSKQLIHRDLKPPNILFSHERTVKIGDFGLATSAINESDSNSIQRTKRTGTVTYMSPEQETQNQYGEKVDIFPLGLIFFELLWRFKTKTERQKTWHSIRNREFPSEFCKQHHNEHKLIEQMLSQEPEERPEASKIAKNLKVLLKSASELQDSKTI